MEAFVREYHLLIRNTTVISGLIISFVILSGIIRFTLGIYKRNKESKSSR